LERRHLGVVGSTVDGRRVEKRRKQWWACRADSTGLRFMSKLPFPKGSFWANSANNVAWREKQLSGIEPEELESLDAAVLAGLAQQELQRNPERDSGLAAEAQHTAVKWQTIGSSQGRPMSQRDASYALPGFRRPLSWWKPDCPPVTPVSARTPRRTVLQHLTS
jgi:hypothetical protein